MGTSCILLLLDLMSTNFSRDKQNRHWPFFKAYAGAADVAPRAHWSAATAVIGGCSTALQVHVGRKIDFCGAPRGRALGRLAATGQLHLESGVLGRLVGLAVAAVARRRERLVPVTGADAADAAGRASAPAAPAFGPRSRQSRGCFYSTQWRGLDGWSPDDGWRASRR